MANLTDETIDKIRKMITILESIILITGFISFFAVYSWLYSWNSYLSFIIALIPAFLFTWGYEMLHDLNKSLNNIKK